jgi:hypothetical protein
MDLSLMNRPSHENGVWSWWLALVLFVSWSRDWTGLMADPAQPVGSKGPTIRLTAATDKTQSAGFEVVGLDAATLAKLTAARLTPEQWNALFAIYVAGAKDDPSDSRPAMLGDYSVVKDVVRFEPRFPLAAGVRYQAVFRPDRLPGAHGKKEPAIVAHFEPVARTTAATTFVETVYPSGDLLPENHFRFYLHFSAPMSQRQAFRHLQLLDASGKADDRAFLEMDEELWDPRGQRFTLFFNPGRVKQGLQPREEFGPILQQGKIYTLVIDRQWEDVDGNPLKESFRKVFKVGPPEEKSPDPKSWKVQPPSAGSTNALVVTFPRPMDRALLERLVWVTDATGVRLDGTIQVVLGETQWKFVPTRPWKASNYHLVVDTRLEDPAGNSISRPFEVDIFQRIEREIKSETIQLPFHVGS